MPGPSPLIGPGFFEPPRILFFGEAVHVWHCDVLPERIEEYDEHQRKLLPLVR